MRKTTLFLLTAVVAVSTVFIGCGDSPGPIGWTPPPATYSKYDRYYWSDSSEAAFDAARANHSLIATTGTLQGSSDNPISPVKTYAEYVQSLKDADAASTNYEYSKWDTSAEPYVFFFSDNQFSDRYFVDILKN